MVPNFSAITTERRGGKMARTSDLICKKLLVVIDHRRTTDLDRDFNIVPNVKHHKKKFSRYALNYIHALILYCYK